MKKAGAASFELGKCCRVTSRGRRANPAVLLLNQESKRKYLDVLFGALLGDAEKASCLHVKVSL